MMVMLCPVPDTFQPFVSYARYYDSNLFRLSDSEIDAASQVFAKTTDQYGVLSAGLGFLIFRRGDLP